MLGYFYSNDYINNIKNELLKSNELVDHNQTTLNFEFYKVKIKSQVSSFSKRYRSGEFFELIITKKNKSLDKHLTNLMINKILDNTITFAEFFSIIKFRKSFGNEQKLELNYEEENNDLNKLSSNSVQKFFNINENENVNNANVYRIQNNNISDGKSKVNNFPLNNNPQTTQKTIKKFCTKISTMGDIINQTNIGANNKLNNFSKVAHEFKTPLNAIIGLITEIKNNCTNNSKIFSNIDIINNLSNYLIFLITDFTQFVNQTTSVNIVIITETITLKPIAEFCFDIMNSLLICKNSNKNISTIIDFDKQLDNVQIISNEMRIKQILLNFISNSVKFTKSGFIKLKAKLKIKNKKKYIKISVQDTGVGIREEDKRKIFQEYFSDLNSEQNKFGSGLGLSICKFLSDKLNHRLDFDSKYGEGTKFSLIIFSESFINETNEIKSKNFSPTFFSKRTELNIINNNNYHNLDNKNKLCLNTQINKSRRKSYDFTNIKRHPPVFAFNKTKTFRDTGYHKNNIYNVFINNDEPENVTLCWDNPILFYQNSSSTFKNLTNDSISQKTNTLNNYNNNNIFGFNNPSIINNQHNNISNNIYRVEPNGQQNNSHHEFKKFKSRSNLNSKIYFNKIKFL